MTIEDGKYENAYFKWTIENDTRRMQLSIRFNDIGYQWIPDDEIKDAFKFSVDIHENRKGFTWKRYIDKDKFYIVFDFPFETSGITQKNQFLSMIFKGIDHLNNYQQRTQSIYRG